MNHAIYPGSFDPLTNGHLDVLDRTLRACERVTLLVAGSGHKNPVVDPKERTELIREIVKGRDNVSVDLWVGLTMEYAKKNGASVVVRGLRAASDFEYEFMMATMNKKIEPEIETLFMMTSQDLYFVSSTMIKELFFYGGDISPYVPSVVLKKMEEKFPGRKR